MRIQAKNVGLSLTIITLLTTVLLGSVWITFGRGVEVASAHTQSSQPNLLLNTSSAPPDDGSVITLIVLYTPAARQAAGGTAAIQAEIDTAVAKTNQVALNSQLNFSFTVVHSAEINLDESTIPFGGLIVQYIVNSGFSSEVVQLRNQYVADIVSLWGENKPNIGDHLVFQPTAIDLSRAGFGIHEVRRTAAVNSYELAHQLGHNLGAGHGVNSLAADLQNRIHPYAFGYGDGTAGFQTIMGAPTALTQSLVTIPYFSNPNVFTNGLPVGSPYSATLGYGEDNVRAMNEMAFAVSNYRITPPTNQTITVDTVIDDWRLIGCLEGVPNDCSLRGAIRLANADTTGRPYTITLAAGQTYPITATSSASYDDDLNVYGDFDVTGNINIVGDGNGATISGNNLRRVFHLKGSLTLRNITVQDGSSTEQGGGIYSDRGRLTLIDSHVVNNRSQDRGGGMSNLGEAVLHNSTVISNVATGNGGGIYHLWAYMHIENSTIARNRSGGYGGGIDTDGAITLLRSTVSTNTAQNHGGGDQYGSRDNGAHLNHHRQSCRPERGRA